MVYKSFHFIIVVIKVLDEESYEAAADPLERPDIDEDALVVDLTDGAAQRNDSISIDNVSLSVFPVQILYFQCRRQLRNWLFCFIILLWLGCIFYAIICISLEVLRATT